MAALQPCTMPVTQRQPIHIWDICGPQRLLWTICKGAAAMLIFYLFVRHIWKRITARASTYFTASAAHVALPPILPLSKALLSCVFPPLWDCSSCLLTMTEDCQSHAGLNLLRWLSFNVTTNANTTQKTIIPLQGSLRKPFSYSW